MVLRFVAFMIASAAMTFATDSAAATASKIEVAPPPDVYATDVNALRAVAAAELRTTDGSTRKVIVSLAVATPATTEPVDCEVDATLRDERTGAVLAVIAATAHATGPLSRDERRALAHAAVRSTARRITTTRVPGG